MMHLGESQLGIYKGGVLGGVVSQRLNPGGFNGRPGV